MGVKMSLLADDIKEHSKIRPLELMHCEYGCEDSLLRKDQKTLKNTYLSFNKQELDVTKETLAKLKKLWSLNLMMLPKGGLMN